MIRIIALELVLSLTLESIQGFGVTSVDDTTTTTPPTTTTTTPPTTTTTPPTTTTTTPTTTTTTTTPNGDDGSAAGVDLCFTNGGNCASCCGACTITTDLDNRETTETCVCYEASTAPSGPFHGTEKNDCVFVTADYVNQGVYVRNQRLGGAEEVLAPPLDARDASISSARP